MLNAMLKLINQQKQKSKKGFTLVELIVVIAILGILAALVVPSVSGYIQKAQDATNEANAEMLYAAAQLYVTDQEVAGNNVTGEIAVATLHSAGYLQKPFAGGGTVKIEVVAPAATDKAGKARVTLYYKPDTGTKDKVYNLGTATAPTT